MFCSAELDHLREGFVGHSEAKVPFRRLHFHDDIELGVNEHHPVVAMFGAQRVTLPPNHFVVFWAAQPHGPIETTPGGWAYGIHLPLPWVLQWGLPPLLMRRLLAGEVVIDPPGDRPAADLDLMKNWVRLLEDDSKELRSVVLLGGRSPAAPPGGRSGAAETVAARREAASPFARNARPLRADGHTRGHALPRAADDRRHRRKRYTWLRPTRCACFASSAA